MRLDNMTTMKLSQLLYHLYDTTLYTDPVVTGLALDSRKVKSGDLFFACKGSHADGRKFIDDAIAKGAVAILQETAPSEGPAHAKNHIPVFPVHDLNQKVGEIAAQFYTHPSKKLKVVGVTGTNGKTSCTHFIGQALQSLGMPCGVIGTIGNGTYGNLNATDLTTPDAITLQSMLADFAKNTVKHVAMEVSSHSLDQGRVNGIEFEVGIFTNLTRDHLDYHGTMEAYGDAKKKLFNKSFIKHAVINADDPFGKKLLESLEKDQKAFAYTLDPNMKLPKGVSVISAQDIKLDLSGIHAKVMTPWGEGQLHAPLIGQFNLSNVLAVLATLCILKIPFHDVLKALTHLSSVPGRMQTLGGKNHPLVVVDYAHTPDALEKVLIALRSHCEKKLYCLFGCGGDRDRGKRPIMAKIAEQYADKVIVTDDNPRTEDPQQIVSDILAGFAHPKKIIVQHDRSKAIQEIIQYATTGDCVLIAGKGAERYQQIGTEKIPFSDVEKVQENLT